MLCELKVENLALIESLHLTFDHEGSASLVVMTGETGAGKSIMLRAIKMLTGERAQSDWVRSGAEQCTVEALFEVDPQHRQFLEKLDESGFGDETTVVIKRIISAQSRSRLYINGSLATAKVVRELADYLLNVAGQHDQQQLLQPQLHLDMIDTLGEHWGERDRHASLHRRYQRGRAELVRLQAQERDKKQQHDFLQFQINEIQQAGLQPGEDEDLAAEKERLKNADSLIKTSLQSYQVLATTVFDGLGVVRKNMEQIAALDPQALPLAEEISGYCFQAEDMAAQLREYRDSLESDPYRLEKISERIDLLQGLKRKYGDTIEEVVEHGRRAEAELQQLEDLETQRDALEEEVGTLANELLTTARALTEKRMVTCKFLEEAMGRELESLAFHEAAVQVCWQKRRESVDEIGPSGWDRLELYFSANPGEPPRQLAKVASGGELSRLMLALKCLLARKDMVETVIFDEVDAGIGGEAAEAVARKIQELAGHHQVFCITHLPQIAARGTDHYRVEKSVNGGRTVTSITLLAEDQRVSEVARMLAGESPTEQTRAWAQELLGRKNQEKDARRDGQAAS